MFRFFIYLIINLFLIPGALAQELGLEPPEVEMDLPSKDISPPAQEQRSQDRDLLLLKKDIRDINRAQSRLSTLSNRKPPANVAGKNREEWQQQSERLQQHAGTLQDLLSELRSHVDQASASESVDHKAVKSRARNIIDSLRNDLNTHNVAGEAASVRQKDAANAVGSISLL